MRAPAGSEELLNEDRDDDFIVGGFFDAPGAFLPAGPVGTVYLAQQAEIARLRRALDEKETVQ